MQISLTNDPNVIDVVGQGRINSNTEGWLECFNPDVVINQAPSNKHEYNGSEWVLPEHYKADAIAKIKADTQAKILQLAPEWKQRNAIARSVELIDKGKDTWTAEEQLEVAQVNQLWAVIKQLREASNSAEQAIIDSTNPADYIDDYEIYEPDVTLYEAIRYEQAVLRLARYRLDTGVAYVEEVPEVRDPETGEITQEYVPAVQGIEPLPATIEQNVYDPETGEIIGTEEVPNPLIVQDLAEVEAARELIDNATAAVENLYVERTT